MVNKYIPCAGCVHAGVCIHEADTLAAYHSLEHQSYQPGGPGTAMPYRAAKNLLFSVSCKFFFGRLQAEEEKEESL